PARCDSDRSLRVDVGIQVSAVGVQASACALAGSSFQLQPSLLSSITSTTTAKRCRLKPELHDLNASTSWQSADLLSSKKSRRRTHQTRGLTPRSPNQKSQFRNPK